MNESLIKGQAAVIQALPEPTLLVTGDGEVICAANPAFRRLLGVPTEAILAQPLGNLVADPLEKVYAYLQNCARSRQPVLGTLTPAGATDAPSYHCEGAVVAPWSPSAPALVLLRLRARDPMVDRFEVLNQTIAELNQEVRERRQAEAQLRVMAEVSDALVTTLDYRAILQQVAELIIGYYADWCMIYLVETDGNVTRAATAHVNPDKLALARALNQKSSYTIPPPFFRVIEHGQSIVVAEFDEAMLRRNVNDPEHLATLQAINPRSLIAVPLQTRRQILGAFVLVWSESERYYHEGDVGFAEEVARRTALVVENARLYQEARTAEAQLREFNRTLEHLVAERTSELERSNHELNQFAYIASHDLKAPLRAISHLTEWLVADVGSALPAVAHGHIAKIRQRVDRMDRLLNDLLAYSRAGRQHHAPETVDCMALVQNVVELVAPPPGFSMTIANTLPVLRTERVPLETIFRNLIANAVKHHHDPAAGQVWVSAQSADELIEFAVRDNGPGIDAQFHERIFEIFQSLKPRDKLEGSGIGLAVVKKIVERRGGTVRVQSASGEGATFLFTWPLG